MGLSGMARITIATSMRQSTFSRRDVAVLQKQSSSFPRTARQPKAERGEGVKAVTSERYARSRGATPCPGRNGRARSRLLRLSLIAALPRPTLAVHPPFLSIHRYHI
jgi:hypothetical protein